jgi:hypothetical protein
MKTLGNITDEFIKLYPKGSVTDFKIWADKKYPKIVVKEKSIITLSNHSRP